MQIIEPTELKKLVQNQEREESKAPITERAIFKLSELQELMKQISGYKTKEPNEFVDICITFVRANEEDAKKYKLCGEYPNKEDLESGTTQLIPIMMPCIVSSFKDGIKSFEYIRRENGIPFIRPGGEGTGLIPPNHPNPDDDVHN